MTKTGYLVVALVASCLFGCSGMTQREQSTLSGGAIGAGGGAILSGISGISGGRPAVGAAVGGAAGALTGYILGDRDTRRPRRR